ncbi:MAG: LytTR family transcriptional regulator DNA-binding domain-containing protein [Cyclobacteriaceae bacterium]
MAKQNSFLIALFIVGLILFDAFQQRFFINTFNLTPEPALLSTLLKVQMIRWSVWGVVALPFGWFVWKVLNNEISRNFRFFSLIFVLAVVAVSISTLSISLISIADQDLEFTTPVLTEFFIFFSFQKGLTFFMAYATTAILLNNYFQSSKVKAQAVEIVMLKKSSEELVKNILPTDGKEVPYLNIKTGNKLNRILLSDIVWIQADDYCVRVHTADRSYTLRKSLKALETQLKPYRFTRVHRGALLNLHFVDQINFESSTIRLQNESELPLSRSGLKTLKKQIKETSL